MPEGGVAVETPPPDAVDHLARLELAHEFRLDVLLGQGKHSAVYLVREGRSSAYMVLKVLPRPQDRDDPQADERFRRAVETIITLDHPHIVPARRYGTTDSLFWYTMGHVRARSLREVMRSRGPLELKMCQRLVAQIASALDYMHRRGVVHGALKPENVLIDPNGWVHLCDPLVTRAIERPEPVKRPEAQPKRDTRSTRQTPADQADDDDGDDEAEAPAPPPARRPDYLSPEDHQGLQRDAASDQYALGVLVHECLAGTLPSAGSDSFEPAASLQTIRPDLPPHVTHAVRRAMSLKPADRYPSALDFSMALETGVMPLTDSRPSGRASEVLLIDGWKPPPRDYRRFLKPIISLAVIGALAAVLWSPVNRWRSARSAAQDFSYAPRTARPYSTPSPAADSAATSAPQPRTDSTPRRPTRDSAAPLRAAPRTRPSTTSSPAAARTATPAPAATAEPGKLFVNASPWGQLFVDGTLVGNTPKANLAVAAGSHTVRVVREGYETWERTIQVGVGETVRLTDIVLTARP
jgi:serine/threonine protein kinase